MYGDATNWNEDEYREAILKEREIQTRTVFRTAWAPPVPARIPNPDAFVVASSDGTLAFHSLNSLVSQSASFGYSKGQDVMVAEPERVVRAHDGPAYDVKFYGEDEDALLLSCGDDGRVRGWRWKEFAESEASLHLEENHAKPLIELTNPQHNLLIQILTGSEDGTARIWDCKTGKCIRVIGSQDKKSGLHISSIALDGSESWLVCGQGKSLALWNLPASECVSTISIPAHVQDVMFDEKQILTVGAEPLLRRFDLNGALLSQIHCAPCSVFSISMHPAGVVAVGGYGGLVDVISQFGSHLCTFRSSSL
ncbi:PREDICTED: THO complex subunit 6-like [Camelina sativa]|uniref:THO complex subunit 6-like n=1 Tax=Camelina sativa TaxID=90675 RepID=A0ABM0WBQ0_CAMSA|nr:PREDICTED: THO complex subunit 6-like [Camelina sativa]